jgi:hypothetical protein
MKEGDSQSETVLLEYTTRDGDRRNLRKKPYQRIAQLLFDRKEINPKTILEWGAGLQQEWKKPPATNFDQVVENAPEENDLSPRGNYNRKPTMLPYNADTTASAKKTAVTIDKRIDSTR